MSANYHTVSVKLAEPEEDGWRPIEPEGLTFTCSAPPDAECRTYPGPDCDCESWERAGDADQNGHLYVSGQGCWLQAWFDNGGIDYTGPDAVDGHPPTERTGPISHEFAYDYVQWQWADGAGEDDLR